MNKYNVYTTGFQNKPFEVVAERYFVVEKEYIFKTGDEFVASFPQYNVIAVMIPPKPMYNTDELQKAIGLAKLQREQRK
jgi:hypothetical protein